MDEIVKLLSSPTAAAISFLIGIIGVGYGIYARGKNPITKRIHYRSKGVNIVNKKSKDIPALQIQFGGSDIKVLTETTIHFWNAGNAGISPSDIPQLAPISVRVPDGDRVLSCRIVKVDGPGVSFTVSENLGGATIPLNVTSIERGKGAILEVLHTAISPFDAVLSGAITDYGAPQRLTPRVSAKRMINIFDAVLIAFFLGLLALVVWDNYQRGGVGQAFLAFLGLGFILLVITSALALGGYRLILRSRRHLVAPSVWHYEKNELSRTELEQAGEKSGLGSE